MNQKDLIKYGLMALGAYLIYKYIQDHGGIEGLLGTGATAGTGTGIVDKFGARCHVADASGKYLDADGKCFNPPIGAVPPLTTILPKPQVLDLTGLITRPDVNDSLTGTVKINGVPTTLSIITSDGRIFDGTGTEVTAVLVAKGVDVNALKSAFTAAQSLSGLGAARWTPAWLM